MLGHDGTLAKGEEHEDLCEMCGEEPGFEWELFDVLMCSDCAEEEMRRRRERGRKVPQEWHF